ncbi:MAG: TrmB family transcriptional regulator, partial [Crenarchaeota archaeon]|nr:TrmB family transcriptional regulator [Thermoproteota archaeon]
QESLQEIGLTEYESRAYIKLVEKGPSTAGNISKLTSIPYSKIYEVLLRLEKKGIIETQKGRPIIFKAIKPSIAIKEIETQLKNKIEKEYLEKKGNIEKNYNNNILEISKAKKIVLEELDELFGKNEYVQPTEDIVWTIKEKANLISQAKNIIQNATSEVRLMLPYDDFSELITTIKFAYSKGVKIQILTHNLSESLKKIENSTEIFIEESNLPTNCGILLSDNQKGMFFSEDYSHGLKTSGKSLLMVLTHFYDHEKEESKKIQQTSIN